MLISLIPAIVKEATEKGLFFIGQERGVIRFSGSHALGIAKKNKVQKRIADSFSLPYNRNFGQGCAAHSFKMAPLARPIFLKMIPLARLISTSKVPWVGIF